MHKQKIYLDTSVISHLQAEDTPEKMQDTLKFWDEMKKVRRVKHIANVLLISEYNEHTLKQLNNYQAELCK